METGNITLRTFETFETQWATTGKMEVRNSRSQSPIPVTNVWDGGWMGSRSQLRQRSGPVGRVAVTGRTGPDGGRHANLTTDDRNLAEREFAVASAVFKWSAPREGGRGSSVASWKAPRRRCGFRRSCHVFSPTHCSVSMRRLHAVSFIMDTVTLRLEAFLGCVPYKLLSDCF